MPITSPCPQSKLTTQTSTINTQTSTIKSIFDFVTDENKVGTYITTSLSPMPYIDFSFGWCFCTGPDGKIYSFQPYMNESIKTICYNPETNKWIDKPIIPSRNTYKLSCVEVSGKVYIFSDNIPNSIRCYDPATDTWKTKAPVPYLVYDVTATKSLDGKIYVFGSYSSYNQCYDPVTDTWTTKAPMPTARYDLAAATGPDGKIYVIGGAISGTGSVNVNECYDPIKNTWNIIWEQYEFIITEPVIIRVPRNISSSENIRYFTTTIEDNTYLEPSKQKYYISIRR
ncbi:MAG: hypothetical protein QW806_09270 [Nitrososphaerota archaeon]